MLETKSYDFVFLRHGESVGNAQERFQGQSDYPLTEAGRRQAEALAERWLREGMQLDVAVTSPLQHAPGRRQRSLRMPLSYPLNLTRSGWSAMPEKLPG